LLKAREEKVKNGPTEAIAVASLMNSRRGMCFFILGRLETAILPVTDCPRQALRLPEAHSLYSRSGNVSLIRR
jgi:hypothetical protein